MGPLLVMTRMDGQLRELLQELDLTGPAGKIATQVMRVPWRPEDGLVMTYVRANCSVELTCITCSRSQCPSCSLDLPAHPLLLADLAGAGPKILCRPCAMNWYGAAMPEEDDNPRLRYAFDLALPWELSIAETLAGTGPA